MQRQSGFTLLELMITVAIIGIIVTVAFPSYQGITNQSARATAQADLMAFAAAMERHKAAHFSYAGAAASGADTGAPTVFQTFSPATGTNSAKDYDLTVSAINGNGLTYVLKATPVTGSPLASDGALYVFSDGRKGWDKNNNGSLEASEYCWRC
ncbi:type IV pilin protein [Opacimonas viscosa]|uniref:Prepilin-type N-terminal cleavage/methylation domain-containing protein n=1 Tax=Opacimonas viscosa TaxID=2961944 RepID=A0AA41X3R4_9ALTE|nr:type IV pilin protein [Opacimonas viscosa]MCP3428938.1 prepilin-type N-terminal cleavage/methylation domain-containing protein [Opacimonas viscosa]